MSEIKNVLICGLGAIGSIYADKIQQYVPSNLRVLVDESRLIKYTNTPTIFNGKELKLSYVLPNETDFKADLIIIATKQSGFEEACRNIKNFVKSDTIILSLLNGVTSEETLANIYGWEKVLLSYYLGSSAMREGQNIIHDGVCTLVVGDRFNSLKSENVKRIKEFFYHANITYKIPIDMKKSLWSKFLLNIGANQTTALFGMNFGELVANSEAMDFATKLMLEAKVIADAEGIDTENMLDEAICNIKSINPSGKTSMLQDIEAGRKTEVELFAGTILRLGERHRISTPYNEIVLEMIKILESKRVNSPCGLGVIVQ